MKDWRSHGNVLVKKGDQYSCVTFKNANIYVSALT